MSPKIKSMRVESKPKVICYLKVEQKNTPLFRYVKELEQYCYEKYEIEEWYIDIVKGKRCNQAPKFNQLMHEILEGKRTCEKIIVLDNNQISKQKKAISLISKILRANDVQIEPMQRYYRDIQIPSLLDDVITMFFNDQEIENLGLEEY